MQKARQVHEQTSDAPALVPKAVKVLEAFSAITTLGQAPDGLSQSPALKPTISAVSIRTSETVLAAVSKACGSASGSIQANLRHILASLKQSSVKV